LRQLLAILKRVDPETFRIIDLNNRRRIERALEIYYQTGLPKSAVVSMKKPPYDFLLIGLAHPRDVLRRRISVRLKARLKQGMVGEVKRLHRQGVSWKRLEAFGLEYRYIAHYLQGTMTRSRMITELEQAIYDFSRRQMTWFKRDKSIIWIKNYAEAVKRLDRFINK